MHLLADESSKSYMCNRFCKQLVSADQLHLRGYFKDTRWVVVVIQYGGTKLNKWIETEKKRKKRNSSSQEEKFRLSVKKP